MAFGVDFKSDASEGDEKKRLADLLGFDRMLDVIKGGEGLVDGRKQVFNASRQNGILNFLTADAADCFLLQQHPGIK